MLYAGVGVTREGIALGTNNPDINNALFQSVLTSLLRASPEIAADLEPSLGQYRVCEKFEWTELNAKFKDAVKAALAKKNQDKDAFFAAHNNDPLTIDYAKYQSSVGGQVKTPRPPAGSAKKITLGLYLAWEQKEKQRMQSWIREGIFAPKVRVGNNLVDATTIRSQNCAVDISKQWVTSFGYDHTILRGSILSDGFVDLRRAIGIICADV